MADGLTFCNEQVRGYTVPKPCGLAPGHPGGHHPHLPKEAPVSDTRTITATVQSADPETGESEGPTRTVQLPADVFATAERTREPFLLPTGAAFTSWVVLV